jgi:hypothetical protein
MESFTNAWIIPDQVAPRIVPDDRVYKPWGLTYWPSKSIFQGPDLPVYDMTQSFGFEPLIITQGNHEVFTSNYDSLLSRYLDDIAKALPPTPTTSVIPASGHCLQELEVARTNFMHLHGDLDHSLNVSPCGDSLREAVYSYVFGQHATEDWIKPHLTSAQVLELIEVFRVNAPRSFQSVEVIRSALRKQLERSFFRRLCHSIWLVKSSFVPRVSRFCAFGWSRRLWFLLHGSHPPKASALLPA